MLGPGSPMCQFMDASLCDAGADARGRVRSLIVPSQPPLPRTRGRSVALRLLGSRVTIGNRIVANLMGCRLIKRDNRKCGVLGLDPTYGEPINSDCIGTDVTLLWNGPSHLDGSLGGDCVEDAQGGCCVHANSTLHACIRDYDRARIGPSRRSSGRGGLAALSASAASAYPYGAINRPETYSTHERSGVDSATAGEGSASA